MAEDKITKVKLSDGQIYSFFDKGALRLDSEGRLITGDAYIDKLIIEGNKTILEIDDVTVDAYDYVLVQNSTTKKIGRRPKSEFLDTNVQSGILNINLG